MFTGIPEGAETLVRPDPGRLKRFLYRLVPMDSLSAFVSSILFNAPEEFVETVGAVDLVPVLDVLEVLVLVVLETGA